MISRMMFYVFSPALAFNAVYTGDVSGADFLRLYAGTLALLAIVGGLSFVLLRWHKIRPEEFATTLVSTFVFNGANFGISIVNFAFGAEALSYAVIIYIAGSTVAWTMGVYVSSKGKASMLQSLRGVSRTPVVYALVAAFALKGAGIHELPPALGRTSQLLADASIPLDARPAGLATRRLPQTRSLAAPAFGHGDSPAAGAACRHCPGGVPEPGRRGALRLYLAGRYAHGGADHRAWRINSTLIATWR